MVERGKLRFSILSLIIIVGVLGFASAETLNVGNGWEEEISNPVKGLSSKAYYPNIIERSNVYDMWYDSTSGINYATSTDGINWMNNQAVNGLTNPRHSKVLYFSEGFDCGTATCYFKIWYNNVAGSEYSINSFRYAESTDGITWTNDQAITQDDTQKLVYGTATGCGNYFCGSYGPAEIIYNSAATTNTGTNPFDYSYAMYYDALIGDDETQENTALAYSTDGKHWTRYGNQPVILAEGSSSGKWDSSYVYASTIIKESNNNWYMWYSGGQADSNDGIGFATSTDGLTWTKNTNTIFNYTDGVSWRNSRTYTPMVIKDGDTYKMWFSGKDSSGNYAIGYATSNYPNSYSTIQSAVDAASARDTIEVYSGTYNENLNVNKEIILLGPNENINPNTETRLTEAIITGQVTISSDNVELNGLTITNPISASNAIGIYSNNNNNLQITNNIISNIGDGSSGTKATGIAIISNNEDIDSIEISNNQISGITGGDRVSGSTSSEGIAIGWSTGSYEVTNLIIQNNNIFDIDASTKEWTTGRGAYGIFINHKTIAPQILDNKIYDLEGLWAHGIGLEGNTPNAIVQGNEISDLTDHKSSSDAVDLFFEANPSADTVAINKNIFLSSTSLGLAIHPDLISAYPELIVDAKNNYWGTNPNFGTLISENVYYAPWFSDEGMTSLTMGQTIETNPTTNITTSTIENAINLTTEDIVVSFPAEITISSSNTSWDGTILPPTIETTATVVPSTEGLVETVSKVIEVGFSGVKLILSKAVQIVIPGEGGTNKRVGYSYGTEFFKINKCDLIINETNLPAGGDCYYDDGTDIIIWTKHFTEFVTYDETDPTAPNLEAYWFTQEYLKPGQMLNFFARFSDAGEIDSIKIRYLFTSLITPSGNFESNPDYLDMDLIEGDMFNGTWSPTLPTPNSEGYYKIRLKANDTSGNNETYSSEGLGGWLAIVTFDGTKPNSTISFTGTTYENFVKSTTQINLNATDIDLDGTGDYIPSGVNLTSYKINDGSWINNNANSTNFLISGADGTYTIKYYSEDRAGNSENEETQTVTLDNTNPTTSDNSDSIWRNSDATITLTPTDSGSGVAHTYYCVDTTGTCLPTTEGTSVPVTCADDNVCNQYVRYYSIDNLGNIEPAHNSNLINIDKKNPTNLISAPVANSIFASDFVVSLSESDDGSGLSICQYQITSNGVITQSWTTRTCNSNVTLTVGSSGNCKDNKKNCSIEIKSIDSVGNEYDSSRLFSIDWTDAPKILSSYPSGVTITDSSTSLTIETNKPAICKYDTEYKSSYDAMSYTMETTGGLNHSQTLSGLIDKDYDYYVICKDTAENKMSYPATISFDVDTTENFAITIPETKGDYLGAGWSSFSLPKFVLENSSLTDYSIENVLSSIDGSYSMVKHYNGTAWTSYVPGDPANDLTEFDEGTNPYWIYMTTTGERIEIE